jgi:FlaA1/EpsC-like NDP-sugar epimerase
MKKILSNLASPALALPRPAKRLIVFLVDLSLCFFSVWMAFYLRLGEFVSFSAQSEWARGVISACLVSAAIALPVFTISGLYRAIFRFSGWPALMAVSKAIVIYGALYASLFLVIGVASVPRTVGIIQPILLLFLVGGSRAGARFWLGDQYTYILQNSSRPNVLVYGAGDAGRQLVAALRNSRGMKVVGFLDDDDRLHGHSLNGQPVFNPSDLSRLVDTLNISDVLLAMPRLNRVRRNEILSAIRAARVAVRTLPSFEDLIQGKVGISDLRELDIDDLLGRDSVMPNHILLAVSIRSKTVMVTGAGGSIGAELCRQILSIGPRKLLMIEQSEFALYSIHQEIEEKIRDRDIILVPLLASVQDSDRIREIMSTWRPDTVYHAAAYKHVPMVEHNPAEGVKNNVLGTVRTAQAALENCVSDFVLISTDKAVRPTNVMGASKRLAELALQSLAGTNPTTRLSIVRFGNVLGSSGSVVPKFRQRIRDGGPISLTHPEVTRFFMSISEAAQLVIQASAMAKGGDVFILDMGQAVKISDLARRMIELSGLTVKDEENPDGDIEIEITGLRPGEKLYEELLIGNDPQPTTHPRIKRAREEFIKWEDLEPKLCALEIALNSNDVSVIRHILKNLVNGYAPTSEIVDWVFLEQEAELLTLKPGQ